MLRSTPATSGSQIVMTVPRARVALHEGWGGSIEACQLFAAVGELSLLKLCRSRGVEWGRGVLAAAAASGGRDDVLEWLIVAGCPKDNMGLKALRVAVDSGRAEVLSGCSADDVFAGIEDGVYTDEHAKADDIAANALMYSLCKRDASMVKALTEFQPFGEIDEIIQMSHEFAERGDVEMLESLEEYIENQGCPNDRRLILQPTMPKAAEHGHFEVVKWGSEQ